MSIDLALIGGTGLYQLPGLSEVERVVVATPYGETSDRIVVGRLGAQRVAFLARHGESHHLAPHRVNYRANVWALHHMGARRVIGVNAVGGITAEMGPRVLAVPDQIIDYTYGRANSFCDADGVAVDHIDFSEPYTEHLRQSLIAAALAAKVSVVPRGTYGATQGPRLETRAEIARMRRDGCDLVGMTGMPEAALARELKLDYACIALVANWAAGCGDETSISLEEIYENLRVATAHVLPIVMRLMKT
jgi:5'-methylthioinosine phosphorylase